MTLRAATIAAQRPHDAKLLVVDAFGDFHHVPRSSFVDYLRRGDAVVANDAATLPASLHGTHGPSGRAIEVRLAGRRSLAHDQAGAWTAVVFGDGDFRIRTEDRPLPPSLARGDVLLLGPLRATIVETLDHARHIALRFDAPPADVWAGIARHGRPIQYAHLPLPLALWDVWTAHCASLAALEAPSAGFLLDWDLIARLRRRGIAFATLTHAAGLSSTGDAALDARLPFDEPYVIPASTARAVQRAKARGGRVFAIGTTVVRALEHAARPDGTVAAGSGLATQRIGVHSTLAIVDAIVSGAHEPGSSHYELLRAFVDDCTLERATSELRSHDYRTHEFGDSVLIERPLAQREHARQRCTSARAGRAIASGP